MNNMKQAKGAITHTELSFLGTSKQQEINLIKNSNSIIRNSLISNFKIWLQIS